MIEKARAILWFKLNDKAGWASQNEICLGGIIDPKWKQKVVRCSEVEIMENYST